MTLFLEYSIVYHHRQLWLRETLSLSSNTLIEGATSLPVVPNHVAAHLWGDLGPAPLDSTLELLLRGRLLELDLIDHEPPHELIKPIEVRRPRRPLTRLIFDEEIVVFDRNTMRL